VGRDDPGADGCCAGQGQRGGPARRVALSGSLGGLSDAYRTGAAGPGCPAGCDAGRVTGMLENLRHDTRLYFRLVGSRLRSQMQYRASFLLMTGITMLGLATEFVAILLLFHR